MEEFLKAVYDVPPKAEVLNGALQVHSKMKWTRKEHLVGAVDFDIDAIRERDAPISSSCKQPRGLQILRQMLAWRQIVQRRRLQGHQVNLRSLRYEMRRCNT